ncbi:MAG: M48 family metalloprotease [Thermoleophilia bacterium]
MAHARELLPAGAPALAARIDTLARRAGVHPVRLALVDDPHQRLFATGRGPGRGTIVLTTGLLSGTSPDRLDALIAHELAHIRHRDALLQTVVCIVAAFLLELTRLGGVAQRVLLFVLAPLAASVVHLLVSPRREFAADASAARLVDSPQHVAEGLLHLDRAADLVAFAASPATGLLYPVELFQPGGMTTLFATHPPLEKRLRRLDLLDSTRSPATPAGPPAMPEAGGADS